MIYIVDHQDSFTWNVVHQFSEFNDVYCSNYFDINKKMLDKADTLVLSPGPGSPKDYPSTSRLYNKYKGKKKNDRHLLRISTNSLLRKRKDCTTKKDLSRVPIRGKNS